MDKVDIMNALRLDPWFMKEIAFMNQITVAENDSLLYS